MSAAPKVTFVNARTCGIYKSGGVRYKTDPTTGQRTNEVDNELLEAVDAFLSGTENPSIRSVQLGEVEKTRVLVPTYFDQRFNAPINDLLKREGIVGITIGELIDNGVLIVRGGHGSPGNDQRTGSIPYVKVSDIRALRVNVNPTNMVTEAIARRLWKGNLSGLCAWDLVTPNRASANIGEFAIILPGEEQVVLTKEMHVFRVKKQQLWDPFVLLWALSLKAVRDQWRRITLMQTNREDCGDRYKEIILPLPPSRTAAEKRSAAFREYFRTIADAKTTFTGRITSDGMEYIATVAGGRSGAEQDDEQTDVAVEPDRRSVSDASRRELPD